MIRMYKHIGVIVGSLMTIVLLLVSTSIMQQQAFALQHFFNCISAISSKDGGDHNLSLQQVIDCFHKHFPHNTDSISSSSSTSTSTTIINSDHTHSQILK